MGSKPTKEERCVEIQNNIREALILLQIQDTQLTRQIAVKERHAEKCIQRNDMESAKLATQGIANIYSQKQTILIQSTSLEGMRQELQMQQCTDTILLAMEQMTEYTADLADSEGVLEGFDLRLAAYNKSRQYLGDRNKMTTNMMQQANGGFSVDNEKKADFILAKLMDKVNLESTSSIPSVPQFMPNPAHQAMEDEDEAKQQRDEKKHCKIET